MKDFQLHRVETTSPILKLKQPRPLLLTNFLSQVATNNSKVTDSMQVKAQHVKKRQLSEYISPAILKQGN